MICEGNSDHSFLSEHATLNGMEKETHTIANEDEQEKKKEMLCKK